MIQISESEWNEVKATLARLTEENRRLIEGVTKMAESAKLTTETIEVMHANMKAMEAQLAARIAPLEDYIADIAEAPDDEPPTPKRRKIDDGGPAVIPFEPPATAFDAALVEAEIETACRELGLSEADADYVMASHRVSDGKLMRTLFAHGCDWWGYVRARIDIREGLRSEG